MTELQKVLYDYAWEYQIPGLLRASWKEAADNDRMVEAARLGRCAAPEAFPCGQEKAQKV